MYFNMAVKDVTNYTVLRNCFFGKNKIIFEPKQTINNNDFFFERKFMNFYCISTYHPAIARYDFKVPTTLISFIS